VWTIHHRAFFILLNGLNVCRKCRGFLSSFTGFAETTYSVGGHGLHHHLCVNQKVLKLDLHGSGSNRTGSPTQHHSSRSMECRCGPSTTELPSHASDLCLIHPKIAITRVHSTLKSPLGSKIAFIADTPHGLLLQFGDGQLHTV
jgi:hypothetical protein